MRKKQRWGVYFLVVGVVSFAVWGLIRFFSSSPVAFSQGPQLTPPPERKLTPEKLQVPSLTIDLPVYQVEVKDDHWPLFEDGLSWLVSSGVLGQPGNVVIYGHNKKHLLGGLGKAREGDLVKVRDQDSKEWLYQVEKVLLVSPKSVGVLSATDYPALTLYTCAGFWDQKRLVVVARLREI